MGRLVDQKDQMTLLKALKNLKNKINFNLIIIGRGINKKKYNNYIKENNIKNLLKFFIPITHFHI